MNAALRTLSYKTSSVSAHTATRTTILVAILLSLSLSWTESEIAEKSRDEIWLVFPAAIQSFSNKRPFMRIVCFAFVRMFFFVRHHSHCLHSRSACRADKTQTNNNNKREKERKKNPLRTMLLLLQCIISDGCVSVMRRTHFENDHSEFASMDENQMYCITNSIQSVLHWISSHCALPKK